MNNTHQPQKLYAVLALVIVLLIVVGGVVWWNSVNENRNVLYVMDTVEFNTGVGSYQFPRLTSYRNQESLAKVNTILDSYRNSLGCEYGTNHESVSASVTYAQNDIFSMSVLSTGDCDGAAHPYAEDDSITFDMKTGKEVSFQDLFADYDRDQAAIRAVLHDDYVKVRGDEKMSDDQVCIDVVADYVIDFATFYVSDKGLFVVPSLPHAVFACTENIPVPVRELSPYLAADSILRRF